MPLQQLDDEIPNDEPQTTRDRPSFRRRVGL